MNLENSTPRAHRRYTTVIIALALAACEKGEQQLTEGQCKSDDDCKTAQQCKKDKGASIGICACTPEGCDPGFVCNEDDGVCEKLIGCRGNGDCMNASTFCDLATGACIERTACGASIHCVPGQVCDENTARCVDGCLHDGDCPLYAMCDRAGTSSEDDRGQCVRGPCSDKSFCDYGEICEAHRCTPPNETNHCDHCDNQVVDPCGPGNFCLINSSYDPSDPNSGNPTFCGISCSPPSDSDTDPCPQGYACGGVVLLTRDQCTRDDQCGGGGRRCYVGEGELRGHCSCAEDADCSPVDPNQPLCSRTLGVCLTNFGQDCTVDEDCLCAMVIEVGGFRCIGTGMPCTTSAECIPPCREGGCVVGAACAPDQGLKCTDVE